MSAYNMMFNDERTIDQEDQTQQDQKIFDNIIDTFDSDQYSSYNIDDIKDMDRRYECAETILNMLTNNYSINVSLDIFSSDVDDVTKAQYTIKIASSLYRVFKVDNMTLLTKIIFKKLFFDVSKYSKMTNDPEEKRNHELMVLASITGDFHESKKLVKVIRHFINDEKFRRDHVLVKGVAEWAADELELLIKNNEISGRYSLDYEIFQKLLKIQNPNFLRTAYSTIIYNKSSHLLGTMISEAIEMWHAFTAENNKLEKEKQRKISDGHLVSSGHFKIKEQ